MSPAKDESSSHRKGKKVAADNLLTKTVAEKTPHFELDHSEEEEGGHDLDSECPPLIDLWYDTHIRFPVVPSDYSSPPSGRVWVSICRHDMEVSWAPLAPTILDLDIRQGTSLLVPILFEFGLSTSLGWKEWVDKELFDMGFMAALQQANVLKTIISSLCLFNY